MDSYWLPPFAGANLYGTFSVMVSAASLINLSEVVQRPIASPSTALLITIIIGVVKGAD
jgi:hypothetical protein